jgi:ADP-ribosylglycohydrolase
MGVVVGDALGLPVQFRSREEVRKNPVTDMTGWGTFSLPPGSWSDDSSLTLCLAQSFIDKRGFVMMDVYRKFVRWHDEGYMTPYGCSYDIGRTTSKAIQNMRKWIAAGNMNDPRVPFGPMGENDNGNGALMRILPAILWYDNKMETPEQAEYAIRAATDIAAMTHSHIISQIACAIYGGIITSLMDGVEPTQACRVEGVSRRVHRDYNRIMTGNIAGLPEEEIRSTGYVVDSLEAAIWCFLRHDNYRDTVLEAVNLGGDTDTIAAIAGGMAGVTYGIDGIPVDWIEKLAGYRWVSEIIQNFADVCLQP